MIDEMSTNDSLQWSKLHFISILTCRVPKISINIGGASGDSLYTMCGPAFSPRYLNHFWFSWMGKMSKPNFFISLGLIPGVDDRNILKC